MLEDMVIANGSCRSDDELAIKTCRMYNYKYAVITPDDFVIPPSNDKIQED